jgi:hypothetical protein
MPEHSKLECDVHDLLNEANTLLLDTGLDVRRIVTLITKLHDCADQARVAGHLDSEQRLSKAADDLAKRLGEP